MAGMPGIAVATRAGVMVASLAVIVLMGGRALLTSSPTADSASLAAATASAPARSASPSPSADSDGPGSGTEAVTPARAGGSVATPTSLVLQKVTVPGTRPKRGRITLRGELTDPVTQEPVRGELTLWRRTAEGRWKPILTDRPTSAGGVVLLDVVQSAGRAVYRLTFAPDGAHAASTSPAVTVRR